jgi:hypothetical protein
MSDTPRTDARFVEYDRSKDMRAPVQVVLADFARELERENAQLRDALAGAAHYMRNVGANIDRDHPKIAAFDL